MSMSRAILLTVIECAWLLVGLALGLVDLRDELHREGLE